jgi:hypothetical protein
MRPRETTTAAAEPPRRARSTTPTTTAEPSPLAADLLLGIEAIGDFTGFGRRRAAHLIATGVLPTFRVGARIAARRSELDQALRARRPAE